MCRNIKRRGDAVKFYMKDIIGMPGLLVTVCRMLPMWSKFKAVANSLPYDAAVTGDFSLPAKQAASLTLPTLVIKCVREGPRAGLAGVLPMNGARAVERRRYCGVDPPRPGGSEPPLIPPRNASHTATEPPRNAAPKKRVRLRENWRRCTRWTAS
jgi:hypothetical protein